MKIKKISKDTWKLLLDYAFKKSSHVSFIHRYNYNQFWCNHPNYKKVVEYVLQEKCITEDELLNNFSQKYIDNLGEELKQNLTMKHICKINEYIELLNNYKTDFDETMIDGYCKGTIVHSLNALYYVTQTELFLEKYQNQLTYKKDRLSDGHLFETEYFFEINILLKGFILSMHNFSFPYFPEDICFLKDNQYWMKSVAHEKLCNIYCESEEEYEYLKSIGVEFYEKEYVPISYEEKNHRTVDELTL